MAGEYADVISGELDRRPELDRLRADAFSRRFNTVCVWRVDRLGRSPQHAFNLHAWFRDYHIDFISLKEQIDTTTPQGMFFFGVCVLFAQWEQACRSERTKLGLAGARVGSTSACRSWRSMRKR